MKNNRGAVLAATVGFILVFTMLGVASIYLGTVQNELAEKRTFSGQAFWLAEGGLEEAKSQVPTLIDYSRAPVPVTPAGLVATFQAYDVCSEQDWYCYGGTKNEKSACDGVNDIGCDNCADSNNCRKSYFHRWIVVSNGTTNGQQRNILAAVSKYDITNAVTSNGTVNKGPKDSCTEQGNGTIIGPCEEHAEFTFENVFGVEKSVITSAVGVTNYDETNYDDKKSSPTSLPYSGITVITNTDKNANINFGGKNSSLSSLGPKNILIIDCQKGQSPCVTINDGGFTGIIWVIGDVNIQGSPNIQGTLFADSGVTVDSKITGTSSITFNATAIDDAVSLIPGFSTKKPKVVSWKEI